MFNVVVLISGNGSNLQAIIDKTPKDYRVVGVISNNPDAYGLQRAKHAQIPTLCINHQEYDSKKDFEEALLIATQKFEPDLVVLAGFMRILGERYVHAFHNKIINIHPSLLPKYPGLNTHQAVLDNQDKEHGVSIHVVTPELDAGPLIAQGRLSVKETDTKETLISRIHAIEYELYPKVIDWYARNKITIGEVAYFSYLD